MLEKSHSLLNVLSHIFLPFLTDHDKSEFIVMVLYALIAGMGASNCDIYSIPEIQINVSEIFVHFPVHCIMDTSIIVNLENGHRYSHLNFYSLAHTAKLFIKN